MLLFWLYKYICLHWLQCGPNQPSWHPLSHIPLMWLHGSLQNPLHFPEQFVPNDPGGHSTYQRFDTLKKSNVSIHKSKIISKFTTLWMIFTFVTGVSCPSSWATETSPIGNVTSTFWTPFWTWLITVVTINTQTRASYVKKNHIAYFDDNVILCWNWLPHTI